VSALTQYPFSRAQRVEFAAGVRNISFDAQVDTRLFSGFTGELIDRTTQELDRPDPLTLGETSAALVYDSAVMGATGPLLGQRYRFEFSQMAGSLLYSGVLADFRRYFMPARPFTIALRGMHFGRYGRDGEDERLSPLFLGYPGLVRGYDIGSFEAAECVSNAQSDCPVVDRLIGTRIGVANAELRFPLYGVFTRRSLYGPLPVELALFGDAGIAWSSGESPQLTGRSRDLVRSVGVALRFNAFGYALGELNYARPLDRPGVGWVWQFNLTPGF
jgi:outer membrane protein assembly factor BamA